MACLNGNERRWGLVADRGWVLIRAHMGCWQLTGVVAGETEVWAHIGFKGGA